MIYSSNLREEELKNKIASDFFNDFDSTQIINEIDFTVSLKENKDIYILWAEAKKGRSDIYKSFVQLILTIGKKRIFDKKLPPKFLGAFDSEKIAFIEYYKVMHIFSKNDFNWNITPSDHHTKEFKELYSLAEEILKDESLLYYFDEDEEDIKKFIKDNFNTDKNSLNKIQIDKNNFVNIYYKWLERVKPFINADWEKIKKTGIIDADFYLADLLSENNLTLKDKLFVLLKNNYYELDRKIDNEGFIQIRQVNFNDNQKSHNDFWKIYKRPPKEEYWDYIIERRDLLVSQDIRERKGSFFTPRVWVEKSQEFIADCLGENWQDEYYIWDLAAGTGNLLAGLTNKYKIFASTIDKADVQIMKDRIKNGANLLEANVFQFDFLNDDFDKCPEALREIINDEEKRKKLLIFINPPYAEASSATTVTGTGENKTGVALNNKTYEKYKKILSKASNELFAQFFIRIYIELKGCILGCFSKLKYVNSSNFTSFRKIFQAKFLKGFIIPADTFDNVKGQFPIGFLIWDTSISKKLYYIYIYIYEEKKNKVKKLGKKKIYSYDNEKYINEWYKNFYDKFEEIGIMNTRGNDFQNYNYIRISSCNNFNHTNIITKNNLIPSCIYLSVRHCIKADWINDRDQFLYPNESWKEDKELHCDCLAFTLFHLQNRITSKDGINHWIPFTETQVNSKGIFKSHFMTDFINGKIKTEDKGLLISENDFYKGDKKIDFSYEALLCFEAGRELYKYYHSFDNINIDASFYDIRAFFQGFKNGRMNSKSEDEKYNALIKNLKEKTDILAKKISYKVYEHGFLKR
ncbi:hypothetical protein OFQ45_04500 [Brachyspira hyodysenteriae]|uniref:hypothetical protein n=1 Tax=Brachyspira hyodysenteriae TaxID=159 RepID=UPI0022CD563D|nr:hypothetical protein [Brachyspira hyodysenteriae]MCZ9916185.1 hypothetical protein [Brachyspira hyodysenteriae]MCZ9942221.1 hypothetical protein [Brachyspira hyodysenteriae]MCZ9948974.1 hypothetical protein [Brachyspira hyodysenteriae]MDA0020178.1 hypothetical protein [Brachyspira hyodysenteriae]MDA0068054.1 hypothetical protein [Brachyspira hyodysenteriae]